MTRQQKISAIYKKIANKNLTLGCKIVLIDYFWVKTINQEVDWFGKFEICWDISRVFTSKDIEVIIWHKLLIWDILDYHNKENHWYLLNSWQWVELFGLWEHPRKPIEDQNNKCIDFIHKNL